MMTGIDDSVEILLDNYMTNPIYYNNFVYHVRNDSDNDLWFDEDDYPYIRIKEELSKHGAYLLEIGKYTSIVRFKSPKHKTAFILKYS